jgi:hypothetical protein
MVSIAQGDGINRSHSIKSKHLVLVTVGLFLVPLQEEEPGIEIVSGRGVGAGEQGSAGAREHGRGVEGGNCVGRDWNLALMQSRSHEL